MGHGRALPLGLCWTLPLGLCQALSFGACLALPLGCCQNLPLGPCDWPPLGPSLGPLLGASLQPLLSQSLRPWALGRSAPRSSPHECIHACMPSCILVGRGGRAEMPVPNHYTGVVLACLPYQLGSRRYFTVESRIFESGNSERSATCVHIDMAVSCLLT